MAPSSTNGAVMPRCRGPPTKVIVFQCPCRHSRRRSPCGARPRSRTIAVLVQVSSMNTGRPGSNMPYSRIQRPRAQATSARFCSAAYRVFLKLKLRRAKNRHTALRLPAIRRLRVAATISSSVRSGWLASDPTEYPRAAPAVKCCRRLALLQRCRFLRNAAPRSADQPARWG